MNILEVIPEVLEEIYTYNDVLTLTKYIYVLIQATHYWFKE